MALTTDEQKLLDHALRALPYWYRDGSRDYEYEGACAVMLQDAKDVVDYWLSTQALIGTASGATTTTPDWLSQHAIDRGMYRAANETDASLKARLKDVPEALTLPSLKAAVQAIFDAQGIAGSCAIEELRRNRAFLGNHETYPGTGLTSTGGTWASASTASFPNRSTFTPSNVDGWGSFVPYMSVADGTIERLWKFNLIAVGGTNSGWHQVTGIDGDSVIIDTAGVVPTTEPAIPWNVDLRDEDGNTRTLFYDPGKPKANLSRGYRIGSERPTIIIILPLVATSATVASVEEMLRTKKAAGVKVIVERRAI